MAKNEHAPKLDHAFLEKLVRDPELFSRLQVAALSEREYHPWRYVKYHAPEGIDARDFWRALVFVRGIRPVGELSNGYGKSFGLAHPEALKRRVDNAYRALSFSIETDSPFKGLDDDRRRVYLQRSLAEEAISSSQLEGAVTTRRVNEAVRNNPDKFPLDYMFVLTDEETRVLRSKISSLEQGGNLRSKIPTTKLSSKSRVAPKAFTEKSKGMKEAA